MFIRIRSTPKDRLRNDQSGDWWCRDDLIEVTVSEEMSPESQLAVAIHELIEAYLCRKEGITDQDVCHFDERYERERAQGKHSETDEPGDDPAAPYREQHMAATHVERAVCHALGLNWKEHEQSVTNSEEDHH